jgi:hypothetical protein
LVLVEKQSPHQSLRTLGTIRAFGISCPGPSGLGSLARLSSDQVVIQELE